MIRKVMFCLIAVVVLMGVASAAVPSAAFTANDTSGVTPHTVQFTDTTDYSSVNTFSNGDFESGEPDLYDINTAHARVTTYSHTGSYSLKVNSAAAPADAVLNAKPATGFSASTSYYWEIWAMSPDGAALNLDRTYIMSWDTYSSRCYAKVGNEIGGVYTLPAGEWVRIHGHGVSPSDWEPSDSIGLILRPIYVNSSSYSTSQYIYYDDLVCVPLVHSWNFGDGVTSTTPHPAHTYTDGVYDVNLSITTPDGTDVEAKTDYITVSTSDVISDSEYLSGLSNDSDFDLLGLLAAPYTNLLGSYFWLVFGIIPIFMMYLKSQDITIPTMAGLLFTAGFGVAFPEQPGVAILMLLGTAIGAIIFSAFKGDGR